MNFIPRVDNGAESKENDQFLEQLWSVQVFQRVGRGEGIEGKSGYLEEIKEREMNKKGQRLASTTTTMETTLGPEGDSSPFSLCLPVSTCVGMFPPSLNGRKETAAGHLILASFFGGFTFCFLLSFFFFTSFQGLVIDTDYRPPLFYFNPAPEFWQFWINLKLSDKSEYFLKS